MNAPHHDEILGMSCIEVARMLTKGTDRESIVEAIGRLDRLVGEWLSRENEQ